MIEEVQSTPALIGLRLSPQKSQVLKNNHVSDAEVSMHGEVVKQVHTFVYLGILMGFTVSCADVITH